MAPFRTGLRFPFELSWSHRHLVDAETITLLQETFWPDPNAHLGTSTAGESGGRRSQCEPFFGTIAAQVEVGLSAQRIYQDLVEQNGFTDSYESVKRFVRKLKVSQPERVWRMECRPGEEVQVDFGLGAPIEDGRAKT